MSNFWNKDGLVVDVIKTSNGTKFITEDDVKSAGGHAVGEQWISFDGTIPEGGLPFDGQLRNIELYQQLFDWAKENGRVIDETEWQQLRETNNGNVPYYSAGDGTSGQKRVIEVQFNTNNLTDGVGFSMGIVDGGTSIATSGTVEEIIAMINSGELGDGRFTADYEITDVAPYAAVEPPSLGTVLTLIITAKECSEFDNNYAVDGPSVSSIRDVAEGISPRESTTFRLPIFNSYFKADGVGGGYIAEGLPNITGKAGPYENSQSYSLLSEGAMEAEYQGKHAIGGGGTGSYYFAKLDASLSNPIYGNSEHVTPETSTVIVGVWAVGSYTNVTNIDMSDIKEAINVASTIDALPLLSYHWDYKRDGNAGWVKADGYWLSGSLYKDAYNKLLEMFENAPPSPTGIDYGMKFRLGTYTTSLDKSNPYDFLIDKTAVAFRLPFLSYADRVIIDKSSSTVINGNSTQSMVFSTFFSDGTVEIEGTYDCGGSTSGTITWVTPVQVPYKLKLQDTRKTGTESDTEGWQNFAGPSNYTSTSFRISHYKGSGRLIDFQINGTPETLVMPKFRMMYFKLGNTFINEEQMDAANISNKIDRVWESWQEADYVVESYSNGTEWYRLYKSGWLEQGGEVYHNVKETHTVNLLLPYRDTYYNVTKSLGVDGIYTDSSYTQNVTIFNYTTTTFSTRSAAQVGLNRFRWRACGYSDNLN
jgi:hypothetical protein